MTKLTIIIPTFNEEEFIAQAIRSAAFADEILIIDSYSEDRTLEIAGQHTVTVCQREFDDFSSQKNYAIDQARHDWIFILDADEVIMPGLREEIISELLKEDTCSAYEVGTVRMFMGREMQYGTAKNDTKTLLFNRKHCRFGNKLVHENLVVKGKTGALKNHIMHYTYRGFDHFIGKKNHYAWLQAREMFATGKKANLFHILVKPAFRFFSEYILKRGFMDGFPGFVSAYINSYGVMTRYIKLWLLQHKQK
ncbi:glycosyltransferase family 2 protein [Sinomicrobium pectinilyticum]|uniref:Glycosyltransferase family 2 protein n=1 Tax=Sinomicrobium pectinilyticum TaxID=1084421 RepID=A0A3N0DJ03_SINP1|nr:glycosyltransferase family 2 protein [Sinomicrobium pectinilyticum]RNL75203.1 glycosyltransferase family 2 protein [Sinomicrobium pectinilyticum]